MPAHKHAQQMLQYAQDAMETNTPWERWQWRERTTSNEWVQCSRPPSWLERIEFRRKPRTISINGFEVPEPEREALEKGDTFWCPALVDNNTVALMYDWRDDLLDKTALSRGLVHLTREAAEIHAKALLSFTEAKV